ncbi:hypothetical protein EJ08DRAFT_682570 [Tothia fuscella]|uniref:Uncharacterized protein n=1 Tax=Tothia fuscella TaxID=1048955 RepID=A0A9P4NI29_9PEZI|nr:hypothetical protein EJ08DRAFT_682570 [Tothia fuscella]
MANSSQVQDLLRFLTNDAKLSLTVSMGKIKAFQSAELVTVAAISSTKIDVLKPIFDDEKQAKQVLAAAKRITKKRGAGDDTPASPVKKKKQKFMPGEVLTPAALEESLELPEACRSEEELSHSSVFTNRAPLVLAFAVTLLKYTMPEQPLSSRLSLAQAVVSANSRTKAVSIGLESGKSAEEEGWGEGQPSVRVMGREIKVLRRWGYHADVREEQETQGSVTAVGDEEEKGPPLWGIDLESMKKKESGEVGGRGHGSGGSDLPICTPQSARTYLLKAFETQPKVPEEMHQENESAKKPKIKKETHASRMADKERNLSMLLGALELLFESWVDSLNTKELDRRAWSWYVRVRPDVESGVAGWGGKGIVPLAEILKLRREVGVGEKVKVES